jgi:ubiquinone/menaquinone biosynthesis C-methylase UbiE
MNMSHSKHSHQHDFAEKFSSPEAVAEYARRSQALPLRNRGLWSALRGLAPEGTWLDLGCGPGLVTIEAASRFPDLRLIGVDSSEHMVEYARDRATAAGLGDRVEFRVGDAADADVLRGLAPADGIVSTYALHHFEDAVTAIRTMAEALAPGGPMLLLDFRRIWWLRRWLPTADAYRPKQAARLMIDAGMADVRVKSHFPYAMTVVGRRTS